MLKVAGCYTCEQIFMMIIFRFVGDESDKIGGLFAKIHHICNYSRNFWNGEKELGRKILPFNESKAAKKQWLVNFIMVIKLLTK